jgi:NTP pyrophosphatase (non-canonical NTP hydrolase)
MPVIVHSIPVSSRVEKFVSAPTALMESARVRALAR